MAVPYPTLTRPGPSRPGVPYPTLTRPIPGFAGTLARTLSQPPTSTPTGGAQPAAPAPAPAGGGQGSPLDATYYQNIADYLFKTNNSMNADQARIGNDQTALQQALGQLNYQQPRSELALEQKANARGGLYSSVYNQNLGDLNQKFLTARTGDQTRFGNDMQALTAAIAGLRGSIPLEQSGEALSAAQRAAAAAQANPALGAPPAPAPPAAAASPYLGFGPSSGWAYQGGRLVATRPVSGFTVPTGRRGGR